MSEEITGGYWVLTQEDRESNSGDLNSTLHRSLDGAKAWALKIAYEMESIEEIGWCDTASGAVAEIRDGEVRLSVEWVELQD